MGAPIKHLQVAGALDRAARPPKLNRHDNQADKPQDEEHKGADHDNGRQQPAGRNEPEDEAHEKDGHGSNGYKVGKVPVAAAEWVSKESAAEASETILKKKRLYNVPRYGQIQLRLDLDKGRKHADDARCRQQHDEDPEIELQRRPVIRADLTHGSSLIDNRAAAQRRRESAFHRGGCVSDVFRKNSSISDRKSRSVCPLVATTKSGPNDLEPAQRLFRDFRPRYLLEIKLISPARRRCRRRAWYDAAPGIGVWREIKSPGGSDGFTAATGEIYIDGPFRSSHAGRAGQPRFFFFFWQWVTSQENK